MREREAGGTVHDTTRERDATADRRDRIADERDAVADERDSAVTDREVDIDEILTAAEERDDQAEARDYEADKRDMAANLDAIIHATVDRAALDARRQAKDDRAHSKTDRMASELDRYMLADVGLTERERDTARDHRITDAVDRIEASNERHQANETRDREAHKRETDLPDD